MNPECPPGFSLWSTLPFDNKPAVPCVPGWPLTNSSVCVSPVLAWSPSWGYGDGTRPSPRIVLLGTSASSAQGTCSLCCEALSSGSRHPNLVTTQNHGVLEAEQAQRPVTAGSPGLCWITLHIHTQRDHIYTVTQQSYTPHTPDTPDTQTPQHTPDTPHKSYIPHTQSHTHNHTPHTNHTITHTVTSLHTVTHTSQSYMQRKSHSNT